MVKTPRDAAAKEPDAGSAGDRVTASGEHAKVEPVGCPHCGEGHPNTYSHCPRTGRPLQTGPALVGRVIAGRYKVTGILGEGGMGAVYIAEHLLLGRKVAIKRLHPELTGDEKAVARFQREARAAAATGHEHIVEVLDLGYAEDGAPYLVMEYLRGSSLAQVLKQEGRLNLARTANVIGQVLAALAAVHQQQIVHRDLKPDNVFLTRRGGVFDYVKVLDFGISKMKQEDGEPTDLTRTGVTMGTPYYMSPEQARGMRKLDHRVDLYAVAVIAYECLTGRLPLMGDNYHALLQQILRIEPAPPSTLVPGLPPGLDAVVLRGLAKDPAQRFSSAAEMLEALVPFGARSGESAAMTATQPVAPPGRAEPPRPPEQRPLEARADSLAPTGRASQAGVARAPARSSTVASRASFADRPVEPERPAPSERSAAPPERSAMAERGPERATISSSALERPPPAQPAARPRERSPSGERRPLIESGPRYFYAASEDWVGGTERRGGATGDRTPASTDRQRALDPSSTAERPEPHEPAPRTVSLPPAHPLGAPAPAPEPRGVREPGPAREAREELSVKGALVLGLLDHAESALGRAAASALPQRVTAGLRAKLDGVILPMAWLPFALLDELIGALDEGGGHDAAARAIAAGRAAAERELTTTHRLFLQTASPATMTDRVPHLHRLYFSRGEAKVSPMSSGVRVELEGMPPESAAFVQWLAGFWQRAYELAGARDVKIAGTSTRGRGDERSSVSLRWR
jgi:serine/threonine-protein kinase